MDTGTIYPDGRISLDGCVPQKWRLLAINGSLLVYHSPGSAWYDNSGRNYGPASIEVKEIEDLRRGNEPGTWRFRLKRLGAGIHFHSTPKTACLGAVHDLEVHGDRLAEAIRRKQSTTA